MLDMKAPKETAIDEKDRSYLLFSVARLHGNERDHVVLEALHHELAQRQHTTSLHIRCQKVSSQSTNDSVSRTHDASNENQTTRHPRCKSSLVSNAPFCNYAEKGVSGRKHTDFGSIIVEDLKRNATVSHLHLECVDGRASGLLNDCFMALTKLPQLTHLTLTHCPHWGTRIVKALALRKSPLRSLHIDNCAMSKIDIRLLMGQISGNPHLRNSLEELSICDFPSMDVTWESNDVLRVALKRLPFLRKLTLVHSRLDQGTMNAIVPLLSKDSPLRHLTIHGYAWDNKTSQMLGAALEHSRLASLNLGFVDPSFSVADLVHMLQTKNCCLSDVDLASIELEPVKGMDELSYWCKLNKYGRATTRRVDLTKSDFVDLLTKGRCDVELSYGLLREVPHMCGQHHKEVL